MTVTLAVVTAATDSLFSREGLLVLLGGAAAIMAMLGLLLLVPLYVTQRREIARLLDWKEREPDAGTTEFRAVPGPGAEPGGTPGRMTPEVMDVAGRADIALIVGADDQGIS